MKDTEIIIIIILIAVKVQVEDNSWSQNPKYWAQNFKGKTGILWKGELSSFPNVFTRKSETSVKVFFIISHLHNTQ